MSEVIFIISLLGGLWAWGWFLTGTARSMWLITMGLIALVVSIMEIVGKAIYGRTISRMYWDWSLRHKRTHWIVMAIMLVGWMSLLWHLSSKVL